MDSLVLSRKYGAVNKTDTEKNWSFVIMFKSEAYKLPIITTIDGKIVTAGKYLSNLNIFVLCKKSPIGFGINIPRASYQISDMHNNSYTTWCYCNYRYSWHIPKNVYRRTEEESISRQPICLTCSDYDYILDEIDRS